jgi:hypothetical protein
LYETQFPVDGLRRQTHIQLDNGIENIAVFALNGANSIGFRMLLRLALETE